MSNFYSELEAAIDEMISTECSANTILKFLGRLVRKETSKLPNTFKNLIPHVNSEENQKLGLYLMAGIGKLDPVQQITSILFICHNAIIKAEAEEAAKEAAKEEAAA